MCLIFNYLENK